MFNSKVIEEIATKSKVEKWSYPKIFNSLKDAGVEYKMQALSIMKRKWQIMKLDTLEVAKIFKNQ